MTPTVTCANALSASSNSTAWSAHQLRNVARKPCGDAFPPVDRWHCARPRHPADRTPVAAAEEQQVVHPMRIALGNDLNHTVGKRNGVRLAAFCSACGNGPRLGSEVDLRSSGFAPFGEARSRQDHVLEHPRRQAVALSERCDDGGRFRPRQHRVMRLSPLGRFATGDHADRRSSGRQPCSTA